jgi:hypothetical protein
VPPAAPPVAHAGKPGPDLCQLNPHRPSPSLIY